MPSVRIAVASGAARITLDRPPLNILDLATLGELHAALAPLATRRDVKAVVLDSALDGMFSAGVDVKDHVRERIPEMLGAVHGIIRLIDSLPQVMVAAIDGRCLGGACEIVAFCDFVLATPRSSFAQPEIEVGCFPPAAAALLPRLIGRRAYEMILLGTTLTAAEAREAGLVTRVVADLGAETAALTARLAGHSGAVLALARKAMRRSGHGELAALERCEAIYRDELAQTHDVAEGVAAFLEKRPPRWSDK